MSLKLFYWKHQLWKRYWPQSGTNSPGNEATDWLLKLLGIRPPQLTHTTNLTLDLTSSDEYAYAKSMAWMEIAASCKVHPIHVGLNKRRSGKVRYTAQLAQNASH